MKMRVDDLCDCGKKLRIEHRPVRIITTGPRGELSNSPGVRHVTYEPTWRLVPLSF